MAGHPLQMGITVLAIMVICACAGIAVDRGNMAWFWGLFFAALFIFAFGVITPSSMLYRRRGGYGRRY
jgi:hypothetical protein